MKESPSPVIKTKAKVFCAENDDRSLTSMTDEKTNSMKNIQVGEIECVLLGTAHISRQSAQQVSTEIASGRYDAVAVELCESRYNNMMNPDQFANTNLWQIIREGKTGMMMANLALGAYQKRLADGLEIEPGADMMAAIDGAHEADLALFKIDREIGITLKRVYQSLTFRRALEIFSGLLNSVLSREKISEEAINKIKQGDMLESAMTEFADKSPDIHTPLIQERDQYMAAALQQLCANESSENNEISRILVVVGAAHVEGMGRFLAHSTEKTSETLQTLNEVRQRLSWLKVFPWVVVVLILIGFGVGFHKSPDIGFSMLKDWVLLNGGLSGIGAILAGAHPLTVLTAIVAAPITSLNPMVGAGMACGLVEAALRKPKVADFAQLRNAATSFRGWWNNRVTRTLLVFGLTSLGSAIGTYLGAAMIVSRIT